MTERFDPFSELVRPPESSERLTVIVGAVAVGKRYLLEASGLTSAIPAVDPSEAGALALNHPVRAISVMTPSPQWMSQLRFRLDDIPFGDTLQLLDDARHCIRWTVAQHVSGNSDHLTVINSHLSVGENVHRIRQFVEEKPVPPPGDEQVFMARDSMNATIRQLYGSVGIVG